MFFKKKNPNPPAPPELTPYEKEKAFRKEWGPKIENFLEEYPRISSWHGSSLESVTLLWRAGRTFAEQEGSFILDENRELAYWEGGGERLERVGNTLSEEMQVAQITLLLKDSPKLSRYCEMASMTLLEEGEAVFSVLKGLDMKQEAFEERWGSPKWVAAWCKALKEEFQAKEVISTGKGRFKMEAL